MNSISEPFFPGGSGLPGEHDREYCLAANIYLLSTICTECFTILLGSKMSPFFRGKGAGRAVTLNKEVLIQFWKHRCPRPSGRRTLFKPLT